MMMAVHQHLPLKFTECRKSPFLYPHYIHAVTQHAARLSESGDEPALQQLQNIWMTPVLVCSCWGTILFRNRSTNGWLLWVSSKLIFLQTGEGP